LWARESDSGSSVVRVVDEVVGVGCRRLVAEDVLIVLFLHVSLPSLSTLDSPPSASLGEEVRASHVLKCSQHPFTTSPWKYPSVSANKNAAAPPIAHTFLILMFLSLALFRLSRILTSPVSVLLYGGPSGAGCSLRREECCQRLVSRRCARRMERRYE
jgi:hypothetical protein